MSTNTPAWNPGRKPKRGITHEAKWCHFLYFLMQANSPGSRNQPSSAPPRAWHRRPIGSPSRASQLGSGKPLLNCERYNTLLWFHFICSNLFSCDWIFCFLQKIEHCHMIVQDCWIFCAHKRFRKIHLRYNAPPQKVFDYLLQRICVYLLRIFESMSKKLQ